MNSPARTWDLFVSHASEDKAPFVRRLVTELVSLGITVWYDEFSILPGDSISRSIDNGIRSSKAGIVIVSPHFLSKKWTDVELRSLMTAEIDHGKRLIPILLNIGHEQVAERSSLLADKAAIQASGLSISAVARLVVNTLQAQRQAEEVDAARPITGIWVGKYGRVWLTQESKSFEGEFEQPHYGKIGRLFGHILGNRVVFEYFWPKHNIEGIGFWSCKNDSLSGHWWSRSSLNKSLDWLIEDPLRLDDFPTSAYYEWNLTREEQ